MWFNWFIYAGKLPLELSHPGVECSKQLNPLLQGAQGDLTLDHILVIKSWLKQENCINVSQL